MRYELRGLTVASIMVFVLVLAGGCGSSAPTSFYLLTAIPSEKAAPANGAAVVVGPVTLPAYLDRPQMVTRRGGTDLDLADFHHWAEPLTDNFTRVLAENLSVLVPTEHVHVFPGEAPEKVDYQVVVKVTRFEAEASGAVRLAARWSLRKDGRPVVTKKSSLTATAAVGDHSAVATALSQTVEALGREIVAAIKAGAAPK